MVHPRLNGVPWDKYVALPLPTDPPRWAKRNGSGKVNRRLVESSMEEVAPELSDAPADGPDGQLRGRHGVPFGIVPDDVPLDPAPGPAAPGVVAGGEIAAGELASVGPPEGDVVVRTFRTEGMFIPQAAPEAGLQALGARGAEERGLCRLSAGSFGTHGSCRGALNVEAEPW